MAKYNSLLEINEILNNYVDEVQEEITQSAIDIATKGKERLRKNTNTYKVRTGKYNKGWRVKTTKTYNSINCVIYNETSYQLSHLLENGHILRNGKRSRAFIHIAPVAQQCTTDFTKSVEEIVKGG